MDDEAKFVIVELALFLGFRVACFPGAGGSAATRTKAGGSAATRTKAGGSGATRTVVGLCFLPRSLASTDFLPFFLRVTASVLATGVRDDALFRSSRTGVGRTTAVLVTVISDGNGFACGDLRLAEWACAREA